MIGIDLNDMAWTDIILNFITRASILDLLFSTQFFKLLTAMVY